MSSPSAHPNSRPSPALNRRALLRAGSLGMLGLNWPQLLAARAAQGATSHGRAKSCILLFMWGGPAHQDTWDLKPDAPAEVRGEFKPIATRVPGVQICEHMPLLAQRADKLAIVRSLTHTNVNHTSATHFLLTGQPPPPGGDLTKDWPHMGSVLARLGRGRGPLPPFVSMRPKPHVENDVPRFVEQSQGQFAGWLGQSYNPLTIDADPSHDGYHVGDFALPAEVSLTRLDNRRELLSDVNEQLRRLERTAPAMDGYYRRAFELLSSSAGGQVFDLDAEPPAVRDRYGRHPHGQSVLQARRLVEAGVPLVTVYWPSEGIKNVSVYWDTHSRNFIDLKQRLMPPADQAFSALLDDLADRGLLDETLVVWTGEFGRTPRIGQRNSDAGAGADGRDHWPGCFSAVLAGGGIAGGQVYGSSDRYAAFPSSNAVAPVDFVATVYHALGVPSNLALEDQQGRPLVICPGTPIEALTSGRG
ncbi:MAG TPA: DUF1501 domain-containing protein [Pirellulales bacterium]|nr:DUF1501 domain-containing protein [Pirellulales bacterium]